MPAGILSMKKTNAGPMGIGPGGHATARGDERQFHLPAPGCPREGHYDRRHRARDRRRGTVVALASGRGMRRRFGGGAAAVIDPQRYRCCVHWPILFFRELTNNASR